MAVFVNRNGDQRFNGTNAEYDQVDYGGSLRDYNFTRNADGTITVTHPSRGTDTLRSIEGFWLAGEERWYSAEDAIRLTSAPTPTPNPNPNNSDIIEGTNRNDTLRGTRNDDVFYGDRGNDNFIGRRGNDTVNYDGNLDEYEITLEANGRVTVTHPRWGRDTLRDIENLNFTGENNSYTIAEAIAQQAGPEADIIEGTNRNDVLSGTGQNDVFYGGRGNDSFNGRGGEDTVSYDGSLNEYTITQNANGTINVSHATWGRDTLRNIENLTFTREGNTYTVAEALASSAGTPEFRLDDDGVLNGTSGNDRMIGNGTDEFFYGGTGNDTYNGRGGFDQINFDGSLSDYTVTQNRNGSFTFDHPVWGTDTLINIEGLWFSGEAAWYAVDSDLMS